MDPALPASEKESGIVETGFSGPAGNDKASRIGLNLLCQDHRIELRFPGGVPILFRLDPVLDALEKTGKGQPGCREFIGQAFPRANYSLSERTEPGR